MTYYFRSIDGEHSENAQCMTRMEAIEHARKVKRALGIRLQVINAKTGKVIFSATVIDKTKPRVFLSSVTNARLYFIASIGDFIFTDSL